LGPAGVVDLNDLAVIVDLVEDPVPASPQSPKIG
jgi:hypothetical protein